MATQHLEFKPKVRSFILAEANGQRSRENITVTLTGTEALSGSLLTLVDTGTGVFAMDGGATGNPTSGAITVGAAGKSGKYVIEFTAATKFSVEDPTGKTIGTGTLGVAFSKAGLGFTLTAGATPAVAGDTAGITVAVGSGKYAPYQAAAAAGPADAVLYSHLPAGTGDFSAVGFVRDCEVNRFELTGLDSAAELSLKEHGVIVRGREFG